MEIIANTTLLTKDGYIPPKEKVTLSEEEALSLIERNLAVLVSTGIKPEKEYKSRIKHSKINDKSI
ncbi:hypothetical protein I862_04305 [endosymbiont of Acanthamoeba sp. UWC8]|uniref:hypothetical protein n=1 Tax=endosymbiont of Acanthamoeba sp. UWC8 TaxID=86106 RepID=UPI0004D0F700|nr:hypothetical protein [endosymbiont of Acanthamoeba sp. UWC8]AIF81421.1 hypothetical protein I862_04305 [endosymbiont of Acanthamoeba sp. UWC8]